MEQFTNEETERIIARAAKMSRSETVTREELIRIADQMGITPAAVEKAIAEDKQERVKTERVEKKRKRYLRRFYSHLTTYTLMITFLFIIDVITGPGWWFYWPMLGWGIGITFHALPLILNKIHSADERT